MDNVGPAKKVAFMSLAAPSADQIESGVLRAAKARGLINDGCCELINGCQD